MFMLNTEREAIVAVLVLDSDVNLGLINEVLDDLLMAASAGYVHR